MKKICWWQTSFGEKEIKRISNSIRNKNISLGKITNKFEKNLAKFLKVDNVIAVTSGSSALLISLLAIGIAPGDEIILPNRTWIATAHAVKILGATPIIVDVQSELPIIDTSKIINKITNKTKAIIPVHINGRSADLKSIKAIAKKYNLYVVEDAAQAIGSCNRDGYLGTQSDIGCFSLSVVKTVSTGQGGFVATNNSYLAKKIKSIRTHGIENVKDPKRWEMLGFNFRFNDILASIGIEQLKRIDKRIDHLKKIYEIYKKELNGSPFKLIPVNIDKGEVPVYNEFLVEKRNQWITKLFKKGIETRPFYPDINQANYLFINNKHKIKTSIYQRNGIYLPSGPSQKLSDIQKCTDIIGALF